MRYELFIALRYLKAKRKQALISLVTGISIIGITLGVAALIISVSLMSGFQEEIQDKILGATAHILVYPNEGNLLMNWREVSKKLGSFDDVTSVTPVIYEKGLLSGLSTTDGVVVKGIEIKDEKTSSPFVGKIIVGDWKKMLNDEKPMVLLGEGLASSIGAFAGDKVTLISMKGTLSPFGILPKMKKIEVAGIFRYGMYEYDSTWAYVSLKTAQKLFSLGDGVTLIEVRIKDIYKAEEIAKKIETAFGNSVVVDTWINQNRSLFSAMKLEKIMLFITLTLIVVVAAFSIVSNLVLMVMEKHRDIAVLMSMGATDGSIMKVFIYQGLIIGLIGTILGSIIGLATCYICNTYKLIHLPQDVYFIPYLPFHVKLFDVVLIISISILISFLATIYPSRRAAQLDPAEAIRYG
jgi:lipoprotein-releasing system permease protein